MVPLLPSGDTLNGWKDIATYLGKSVRAVQRWERDHRLPVYRIKTPTGQVVYAFRSEIDAWRVALDPQVDTEDSSSNGLSAGATPSGDASLAPGAELGETPIAARFSGKGPRGAVISLAIAGAIVLLGVGLLVRQRDTTPLAPSQVVVSGQSLLALSKDGAPLWSHRLGWTPGPLRHRSPEGRVTYLQADIDGDGSEETFVVVHDPEGQGEPWKETIYCFSSRGQLQWTYTPSLALSFGGRVFEGPWRIYALITSGQTGRQRVWASYGHHTWWPSFVVELDAHGTAVPRYFQSGAIYTMNYWSTLAHNYLVAGGVDNSYGRASVAVLDVDGPAVASPDSPASPEYRCQSCPVGRPELFALLPQTEVSEASDVAYNWLSTIRAMGNETVMDTVEGPSEGGGGATYNLHSDLTFRDAGLGDRYWKVHGQLEQQAKIAHAGAACPDIQKVHFIRTWRPNGGWANVPFTFGRTMPGR